ncbi:MAG: hypothetical protein ACHQ50_15080 [Fimbriimonadales bacterium]
MKVARRILLAMATLGLSSCVALNRGSLAPTPRAPAEHTLDVAEFVAEHNRNAERIESLTAKPSIGVSGKMFKGRPDGRLDLVRPRKFKLVLKSMGTTKADIGSNDEEFWFWVQGDDKSIYWCNYDELDSTPLAVTYQPDWIIEALGLKPISALEAAGIKVREGAEQGTTGLVFPPTRNGGETYTRMMIVSNQTRRIKEHRIYAGNLKTLLAQAEVKDFKDFDLGSSESGARGTCYLPESVKLDWKRDQLTLDVLLRDVTINQFEPAKAAAYFVEPVIPGYERVNLAEMSRGQPRESRTTVRRTLPPPEPRNGVKLGRPAPVSDDTTMVAPLGSALARRASGHTTSQLEELVNAPSPVAPEAEAMRAASAAWSAGDASPIGR